MANALLIANRTEKVNQIENLLSEHFQKVSLVSEAAETGQLPREFHYDLIVATDSYGITPDDDFLSCLRGQFPNAKFMYLADEIAPQTEMSLRAGGLIFLGSYDHFIQCAHQILGSIADSVKKF